MDASIVGLIEEMNAHAMLCTTSSCAGRVTLFTERDESTDKKGGEWIYVTHERPDLAELRQAIHAFLERQQKGAL